MFCREWGELWIGWLRRRGEWHPLARVVQSIRSMFCPQCRAEYRPGFSHCADCDVDLVEDLPKSSRPDSDLSGAHLKRAWFSEDSESCVYVCSRLTAAGIPFRVTQRKHQVYWNVDEHYEVWVPTELYDEAKTLAEQGYLDFSDSEEDQKIMELPDQGVGTVKRDSWNSGWSPEDANVEVWSEKTEEQPWHEQVKGLAWMIELSLHENGIGTHTTVSQEGIRRIFVRAEDEFQAREIVREIESGTPPT
jgi:hypothetical protein